MMEKNNITGTEFWRVVLSQAGHSTPTFSNILELSRVKAWLMVEHMDIIVTQKIIL